MILRNLISDELGPQVLPSDYCGEDIFNQDVRPLFSEGCPSEHLPDTNILALSD